MRANFAQNKLRFFVFVELPTESFDEDLLLAAFVTQSAAQQYIDNRRRSYPNACKAYIKENPNA